MMTKEETVAFGNDVAARLRGEEPVADVAALVAGRIADVAAEDFVAWCRAIVDGVPATSKGNGSRALWEQDDDDLLAKGVINEEEHATRRARIDTEMSMAERYQRRQTDVNVLLVKVEAFNDAFRRHHAWATAQKDK